jgi:hypothetical protein
MAEVITTHRYVRSVSGNLISSQITDTQSMRIEILKRTSRPKLQWLCVPKNLIRVDDVTESPKLAG